MNGRNGTVLRYLINASQNLLEFQLHPDLAVQKSDPGAVIAVQTFGDFLGFNPHFHILVTDGCFYGDGGMFRVAPPLELKKLEAIFRHKVFRMLLDKGKITKEMIAMLSTWRHSGFNVFCGNRISPDDDTAMENLARYIIRASFSQERMQYLDQEGTVVYTSKNDEKIVFLVYVQAAISCRLFSNQKVRTKRMNEINTPHSPLKTGLRFSAKAASASSRSFVGIVTS